MKKINSHNVFIGHRILKNLGHHMKKITKTKENIFIVSHPRIMKLYGDSIIRVLKKSGFNDIGYGTFPEGEENKSKESFEKVMNKLTNFAGSKGKKTILLNLGGGVVGDLGGFVAATYHRGIPYLQIPTTLLADVDSSIGGKVGIDYTVSGKTIKNLIGQFYQPKIVFIELSFLNTLFKRDLLNGLAEVIKYGVIQDRELFRYLETHIKDILRLEPVAMTHIVFRSAKIKSKIVEQDEKETKGLRTILNYGHTIGHALEGTSNLTITHGEAISVGMICAAKISRRLGLIKKEEVIRIENLIRKTGLPTKIKKCNIDRLIEIMRFDKKFKKGTNRFVLPTRIGKVTIKTNINESIIKSVLCP